MAGHDAQRFQAMVEEYRRLVGRRAQAGVEQRARFLALCEQARALIGPRLLALSGKLRQWRVRFGEQVPVFDLFEALGIAGKENRYTDLLAWLCQRPDGPGEAFARELLARVHPSGLIPAGRGALLRAGREVVTDEGRVDLVLEFERMAIAVEVKVWSEEHDTPGARPQTVSYPEAVARRLVQAGRSKPVVAVLLSPAGTPPLGTEAGRLSFFDVADGVLGVLGSLATVEERALARLFVSHVLETAGWVVAGRSFWEIERTLARRREDWPAWVIQESSRLAMLATAMEVNQR